MVPLLRCNSIIEYPSVFTVVGDKIQYDLATHRGLKLCATRKVRARLISLEEVDNAAVFDGEFATLFDGTNVVFVVDFIVDQIESGAG